MLLNCVQVQKQASGWIKFINERCKIFKHNPNIKLKKLYQRRALHALHSWRILCFIFTTLPNWLVAMISLDSSSWCLHSYFVLTSTFFYQRSQFYAWSLGSWTRSNMREFAGIQFHLRLFFWRQRLLSYCGFEIYEYLYRLQDTLVTYSLYFDLFTRIWCLSLFFAIKWSSLDSAVP